MNQDALFFDVVRTRASVRSFQDKPVPREAVDHLVKAAMAAPSGRDTRPWCFVVVSGKDTLARLGGVLPNGPMLPAAPLAIMVGAHLPGGDRAPGATYWMQDCSAATQNMLLAAHALGLGAVWIAVTPRAERQAGVREVLGLPEDVTPLCMVVAGYPAAPGKPYDKFDPERVHWEKW